VIRYAVKQAQTTVHFISKVYLTGDTLRGIIANKDFKDNIFRSFQCLLCEYF
jgi:hypothetical protein